MFSVHAVRSFDGPPSPLSGRQVASAGRLAYKPDAQASVILGSVLLALCPLACTSRFLYWFNYAHSVANAIVPRRTRMSRGIFTQISNTLGPRSSLFQKLCKFDERGSVGCRSGPPIRPGKIKPLRQRHFCVRAKLWRRLTKETWTATRSFWGKPPSTVHRLGHHGRKRPNKLDRRELPGNLHHTLCPESLLPRGKPKRSLSCGLGRHWTATLAFGKPSFLASNAQVHTPKSNDRFSSPGVSVGINHTSARDCSAN